jgi:hypothetical protein
MGPSWATCVKLGNLAPAQPQPQPSHPLWLVAKSANQPAMSFGGSKPGEDHNTCDPHQLAGTATTPGEDRHHLPSTSTGHQQNIQTQITYPSQHLSVQLPTTKSHWNHASDKPAPGRCKAPIPSDGETACSTKPPRTARSNYRFFNFPRYWLQRGLLPTGCCCPEPCWKWVSRSD